MNNYRTAKNRFSVGDIVQILDSYNIPMHQRNKTGTIIDIIPMGNYEQLRVNLSGYDRPMMFLSHECIKISAVEPDAEPIPEPETKKTRRPPLNLRPPRDDRTESQRQAEGVAFLTKHGFIVLQIGQGRKAVRCNTCGDWQIPTGFIGNSEGAPDTLVTHPDWPAGAGLMLEWKKTATSKRQPAQEKLEKLGRIVVVWDLATCLTAVAQYTREFRDPIIHPAIDAWLKSHHIETEAK